MSERIADRRHDPLLPNAWIVARREYVERVRSRLFVVSTLVLVVLAVLVAFAPIFVKAIDSGTTTRVAVAASDEKLAERAIAIMEGVLNAQAGGRGSDAAKPYAFVPSPSRAHAIDDVSAARVDAALVAQRTASGAIDFTFYTGEGIGPDRAQLVGVGTLAVAILDWTSSNTVVGREFTLPTLDVIAAGGPTAGGAPITNAEFTGRRVVGIVFVVLIFLLLVVYGMWVAAGVVAEKTSRVMELIVAAGSARQLLVGKVVGIGLAGFTQYACVLAPALLALVLQDQIATVIFGQADASISLSLAALTPGLLGAYALYVVLGFVLYGCIYAAAGSLVSRPEDLQTISLPLSLIAVAGYMVALLSLSGGLPSVTRFASFVPFWSPFVMTTRLSVSRVEPRELLVSFGLLVATIGLAIALATRAYAAGVLLYGQRPGLRAVLHTIR
ncbi:MAG: ABC transporter permease [Chloroflexi bacterium]|nr:ABC transporter permease [Chloroflexota bacterium]